MSYGSSPLGTLIATLADSALAVLSRSIQVVRTLQGTYVNAPANGQGVPFADSGLLIDALGTVIGAEEVFVSQDDCVYGLDTDEVSSLTLGTGSSTSGSVTNSGGLLQCTSGTTSTCRATLRSKKYHHYSSGQAALAKASVIYATPTSGNTQILGPQNPQARFGIGYNGTALSVFRQTGARQEVRTLTFNTQPNATGTATVTVDGVAFSVGLTSGDSLATCAAKVVAANTYPNWEVTSVGAVVTFVADWRLARSGTYSYAAGTTGISAATFAQVVAGADFATSDITALTAVNGDKLDGSGSSGFTFDRTKLNVFLFQWAYLGTAPAAIYICGNDSRWHLIHRFPLANLMANPNFSQPSFHIGMTTENSGNTTALTMQGASLAISNSGAIKTGKQLQVAQSIKTGLATDATFKPLLSIRCSALLNSKANFNVIIVDKSSISSSSTQPAMMQWIVNGTLTGAAWTAAASGSIAETDTSATAVSGGRMVDAGSLGAAGAVYRQWTDGPPLELRRGDTLTLAVRVDSGATYTSIATLIGRET